MNDQQQQQHQHQPRQRQEPPMLPTEQTEVTSLRVDERLRDDGSMMRSLLVRVRDTCKKPVERALHAREMTMRVRLSDDAKDKVDSLVAAGVFETRGATTAFLIDEGINAQASLFRNVDQKMSAIESLRSELRNVNRSHVNA